MTFREGLAYFICPILKDEIAALREGNTKIVLENCELLDEISALKSGEWRQDFQRGYLLLKD